MMGGKIGSTDVLERVEIPVRNDRQLVQKRKGSKR